MARKYLYSTTKRGKVRVTSRKQHELLHARDIPHMHVYRTDSGSIVRIRSNPSRWDVRRE